MSMFKWLKKRPHIRRQDLLELITATPNAAPGTHQFLVPYRLEDSMKWAIGKPFCICLWWETFEGYGIQPTHPDLGDPDELTLIARKDQKHYIWTSCR